MAEPTRYRIGPLTTYADPAALRASFERAGPGKKIVYAIGPALGRDAETPRVARALAGSGAGRLHREGNRYVIVKNPAACASSGASTNVRPAGSQSALPGRGPGGAGFPAGSPEHRLLAVLEEYAADGQALPSNALLAELAELPDGEAARYRLRKLSEAGLVRVTMNGTVRRVRLTAKGRAA